MLYKLHKNRYKIRGLIGRVVQISVKNINYAGFCGVRVEYVKHTVSRVFLIFQIFRVTGKPLNDERIDGMYYVVVWNGHRSLPDTFNGAFHLWWSMLNNVERYPDCVPYIEPYKG